MCIDCTVRVSGYADLYRLDCFEIACLLAMTCCIQLIPFEFSRKVCMKWCVYIVVLHWVDPLINCTMSTLSAVIKTGNRVFVGNNIVICN